jgi:hypothetical protein
LIIAVATPLEKLMRWILIGLWAALAACAGTPPEPAAAPASPASPQAATNVQVTGDAKTLLAAQGAGYKVVNKDGQQLLCRKDRQTGSHTRYTTSCLTLQEWEALARSSRQTTEDLSRRRLPPPSN